MRIPRLFQLAALVFFILGLLIVPISSLSPTHSAHYEVLLYVVAAAVFWVWLYRDAPVHSVSRPWQLLVAAGWLVAAVPVVPVYLLFTRGWKQGSVATLAMITIVLVTFAIFGMGTLLSTIIANTFGLVPSEA
jgi:hypothetical protein